MYYYKEELINKIEVDKPDPAAAKVLQETLGGQFGEMRTMMQYFFQSSNFRKREAIPRFAARRVPGGNLSGGEILVIAVVLGIAEWLSIVMFFRTSYPLRQSKMSRDWASDSVIGIPTPSE